MAAHNMLLKPVTDPSAWTRADMDSDKSWIYALNNQESNQLNNALTHLVHADIPHRKVKANNFPLENFETLIRSIQDQIENGRGIAVLKGLPVAGKTVEEVELLYAGIAAHIGKSIVQDTQGTVIDHVYDRGQNYNDISVRGYTTNAKLTPHCDSGDIVALLCVRPAREGGINTVSSSMAVYNAILAEHPHLLEALYTGFHYNIRGNGPPGKFVDITAHRVPVYSFHDGKLSCRFNEKAMLTAEQLPGVDTLTELETEAIKTVARLSTSREMSFDIMLEPGDLLLLCNHSIFHTRAAFEDWNEPERKRLLLRKWINIPNGRALTWEFADHYNTGPRQGPYVEGEPGQTVMI